MVNLRIVPLLVVAWLSPATGIRAGESNVAEPTAVEHVIRAARRSTEGLGTVEYQPSDKEKAFFAKLAPEERTTGGSAGDYDIATKDGKYVGWFGIVRDISEDAVARSTTLLVEHKYFDGLTDAHIQALSFNGSGGFRAVLRGVGHNIARLTLVKVYGKVSIAARGEPPRINAVYVRNWHWGAFTFLAAYGTQHGSQQWRKLNQADLDHIYDPDPDATYYEERLGKRAADDPLYRRLLKPAGRLTPDIERLMIELIDSLDAKDLFPVVGMVETIQQRQEEHAAVAVLLAAVQDEEIPSWSVCVALSRLSGPAELPPLVALLKDRRPDMRFRAADVLSGMGKHAAPAVPDLVGALQDTEPNLRSGAADALGAIGVHALAAVGPLQESLKDGDSRVRLEAAEALREITFQAEPSVSVLIAGLKDADQDVRSAAAEALERIGPAAVQAGPALIAALKDQEQFVRSSAAAALGAIRPRPEMAIPALAAALRDEDLYVRAQAAEALGHFASAAQPAVPALIAALKDEDDDVRFSSAVALGEIGPAATQAIPALIDMLQHDSDDTARCVSAEALGSTDAEGRRALPALIQALADESADVRGFAAYAVGKIGPNAKAALPALHTAVEDEDVAVRIAAAEALWTVSQDAGAAMPVLLEVLKDHDGQALMWAANAVRTIGPATKGAVPGLVPLVGHENGNIRASAIGALGSIGPGASAAVPALVDALRLRDDYRPCAMDAAEALWHINQHPRAIPTLIELLATDNAAVSAAEALGRIGPAARASIPALRENAKNLNPEIRKAAIDALQAISRENHSTD